MWKKRKLVVAENVTEMYASVVPQYGQRNGLYCATAPKGMSLYSQLSCMNIQNGDKMWKNETEIKNFRKEFFR